MKKKKGDGKEKGFIKNKKGRWIRKRFDGKGEKQK